MAGLSRMELAEAFSQGLQEVRPKMAEKVQEVVGRFENKVFPNGVPTEMLLQAMVDVANAVGDWYAKALFLAIEANNAALDNPPASEEDRRH